MNEYVPLTPDELLFSLEKLVDEFGASNAREKVMESLAGFEGQELTNQQCDRLEALKTKCLI